MFKCETWECVIGWLLSWRLLAQWRRRNERSNRNWVPVIWGSERDYATQSNRNPVQGNQKGQRTDSERGRRTIKIWKRGKAWCVSLFFIVFWFSLQQINKDGNVAYYLYEPSYLLPPCLRYEYCRLSVVVIVLKASHLLNPRLAWREREPSTLSTRTVLVRTTS
jgi:hypothetical protein